MTRILGTIFKSPFYLLISLLVFLITFSLAVLFTNLPLIVEVLRAFGAGEAFRLSFSLLSSIHTNFTPLAATFIVLICFFFALNVSLFIYHIRKFKKTRGVKTSTSGLIIGALGIGCASCGSLLLTTILTFLGLGGAFTFLPLAGAEFSLIGLVLLMVSTYFLLKKVSGPVVCRV